MAGWLRHYCRAVRAASLAVADGGTSAACGRRTGVATVPQIQTNPMSAKRVELIRNALCTALRPHELDIVDESHLHAGHAGAASGGGHFRATIVSGRFAGLTRVRAQQLTGNFWFEDPGCYLSDAEVGAASTPFEPAAQKRRRIEVAAA